METTGDQSRRKGETYHEYMQRLYNKPLNRGITAVKKPNHWSEIKERWSFRPPTDLTPAAYKFMRKNKMSITTYLTFAMHNLHNNNND